MEIQGLLWGNATALIFFFTLFFTFLGGFRGFRGEVGVLMWGFYVAPED